MRILLVEDEVLLGDALQVGLRSAGFVVDWVKDGVAADAALAAEEFAAVVLDLGLPRMSGLELLRRLRDAGNRTPVVILTARDAVEDRVRGLDLGADDYVAKPVSFAELAARLRAVTRRARGAARGVLTGGHLVGAQPHRRVRYWDRSCPVAQMVGRGQVAAVAVVPTASSAQGLTSIDGHF